MGLDGAGVHIALLDAVYDVILYTPAEVQKATLKGIINSLLREWRGPRTKDDLRAYFILLQNPQFGQSSTCVIFAHVLRQVSALPLPEQRTLVQWLHRLHISRFRALLGQLHALVSLRLSQDEGAQLPPPAKSSWWIPAAVRVTALLYAANVLGASPRLPYSEFYNSSLDHVDLTQEYLAWQCNPRAKRFSFCQFPWMLSIHAKKAIIQQDSEQQMVTMARRSVVERVSRRERPDVDSLFLTLRVRRAHLVVDSLSELARKRAELKKKLRVEFVGEVGLDMGGLTKEWFLLLIRQVLRPDYGMFVYHREARCYWFRSFNCDNYSEFSLIGTLMGLAVYNSIPLDLHFPLCCYRKLLSPPLAPSEPGVPVGLCALTLGDLGCVMPELAHGLQELLLYEGDVETDMCATFQSLWPCTWITFSTRRCASGSLPSTTASTACAPLRHSQCCVRRRWRRSCAAPRPWTSGPCSRPLNMRATPPATPLCGISGRWCTNSPSTCRNASCTLRREATGCQWAVCRSCTSRFHASTCPLTGCPWRTRALTSCACPRTAPAAPCGPSCASPSPTRRASASSDRPRGRLGCHCLDGRPPRLDGARGCRGATLCVAMGGDGRRWAAQKHSPVLPNRASCAPSSTPSASTGPHWAALSAKAPGPAGQLHGLSTRQFMPLRTTIVMVCWSSVVPGCVAVKPRCPSQWSHSCFV
nr:probable E3 ubiquitin-protein ligase HECTD2 isoform X3 [Petromyzon marinus]